MKTPATPRNPQQHVVPVPVTACAFVLPAPRLRTLTAQQLAERIRSQLPAQPITPTERSTTHE